jgi:hypothetical protein
MDMNALPHAVLTGDLIGSTELIAEEMEAARESLLAAIALFVGTEGELVVGQIEFSEEMPGKSCFIRPQRHCGWPCSCAQKPPQTHGSRLVLGPSRRSIRIAFHCHAAKLLSSLATRWTE